tara:strand:+ start:2573 stop:3826 length:1254 start_codon:yes stop_codon:yes gene_type:complete
MAWDSSLLSGPEGEDWRIPVSELEDRQKRLARKLAEEGTQSVFIEDPVEIYWLTGGRQNSSLLLGSEGSGIETRHWVRRSLDRAIFEGGGGDSPHITETHPRMAELEGTLAKAGCTNVPAMQGEKVPGSRLDFIHQKINGLGGIGSDCSRILYELREKKSDWEISRIRESGEINRQMFDLIADFGGLGKSELEMAGAAEELSRSSGFGGRIRMRKWPMDCDRVVIAAGRSGGVPSYFDAALGGTGGSPISPLGAGFSRVKESQPVLVDIVHVHRGYVSDCTRMFSAGSLSQEWMQRLEDMVEISSLVKYSLGRGDECSKAWEIAIDAAQEMGHGVNLMGVPPNQAKFLGHSVGLELDESPVVAKGFDRQLEFGGVMAIEPKLVFDDGAIGVEDTWARNTEGMKCLTAGEELPYLKEW